MAAQVERMGRNDPCMCGSGKKYKKCCLNLKRIDSTTEDSIERLKENFPDKKVILLDSEKAGVRKMSEVILEYANELLSAAPSREDKEKAIMFAIAAWNISFLKKTERQDKINEFLKTMALNKNTNDWNEAYDILHTLIVKKLKRYKTFSRFVVEYKFIKANFNDYRLNVISTILED